MEAANVQPEGKGDLARVVDPGLGLGVMVAIALGISVFTVFLISV